jgi:hypothetical protein
MSPLEIYVDGRLLAESTSGWSFEIPMPSISGCRVVYSGDKLGQGEIQTGDQNQCFELTQAGQVAEIEVAERASFLFTMASVPKRKITVKRV